MAYLVNVLGEPVTLSVLIGADQSLIGLKVNSSKIISMKFGELGNIVLEIYGIAEKNRFVHSVMDHCRLPTVHGEIRDLNDCDLIVLETICENPSDYFATYTMLKALKLYHGADIYSCYSVNYRFKDGKLCYSGIGDMIQYRHAIGMIKPHYALTEKQKTEFAGWYSSVFLKINQSDCNDVYRAMVRRYDTSYMIGICEAEYIMLFTILETLFGKKGTKITGNIAKGTSVLIGGSAKEKRTIKDQMYKLYDVRSGYVHHGKDVSDESLFKLREIVRRVLVEICNRGYHVKDKSLTKLRNTLLRNDKHSPENAKKDK